MTSRASETLRSARRAMLMERFSGDGAEPDEEAALELLLACGSVGGDPHALARRLLGSYGDLSEVLGAPPRELGRFKGLGAQALALIKAGDWLRRHCAPAVPGHAPDPGRPVQMLLFDVAADEGTQYDAPDIPAPPARALPVRRGTGMFTNSLVRNAIDLLPDLPDTSSLRLIKGFVRKSMREYGGETLRRFTNYLVHGLFPHGYADAALRHYARLYPRGEELADVCFYRFCKAESLMVRLVEDVLMPKMLEGFVPRKALLEYLTRRYPNAGANTVKNCSQAAAEALTDSRVLEATRARLSLAWRAVVLPSFAFVLHSEFPEPGNHDMAKLEKNPYFRALFWPHDGIVEALYRLKEAALLGDVSESYGVRRFTTTLTLDQLVRRLAADPSPLEGESDG